MLSRNELLMALINRAHERGYSEEQINSLKKGYCFGASTDFVATSIGIHNVGNEIEDQEQIDRIMKFQLGSSGRAQSPSNQYSAIAGTANEFFGASNTAGWCRFMMEQKEFSCEQAALSFSQINQKIVFFQSHERGVTRGHLPESGVYSIQLDVLNKDGNPIKRHMVSLAYELDSNENLEYKYFDINNEPMCNKFSQPDCYTEADFGNSLSKSCHLLSRSCEGADNKMVITPYLNCSEEDRNNIPQVFSEVDRYHGVVSPKAGDINPNSENVVTVPPSHCWDSNGMAVVEQAQIVELPHETLCSDEPFSLEDCIVENHYPFMRSL